MTKSTSDSAKKKKQKKKETEKYLATAPGTVPSRIEFIETHKYVNGVRNERGGDLVIRALNDEEKAWLANFNKSYEHDNYKNDNDYLSLSPEEQKEWQRESSLRNNARNRDLYFKAKSTGNLVQYDMNEYEKLTSESEKDISGEDLKLNYLEDRPKKVRRRRVKKQD